MLMNPILADRSIRRVRQCGRAGPRSWALALKCVLGLSLTLACQTALAQAMYRVKPLGYLGGCTSSAPTAYGFNKSDRVTGQACNAHGDQHAFLWKNDGTPMVDLGPNEVGSTSTGYAINSSGLITGGAQDSTGDFAFLSAGDGKPMIKIWEDANCCDSFGSAINDLGQVTGAASDRAFLWRNDGSPLLDLGVIHGLEWSAGAAINEAGQVAGVSGLGGELADTAFVWENNGTPLLNIGGSAACCINASGQVAVNSFYNGQAQLWSSDGTPAQHLGGLIKYGNSWAAALNDSGQVAGYASMRWPNYHAFVWMNDGTPMKNLGTFGGSKSQSNDINASGQVTGWANTSGDAAVHAFLWRNDGTKIHDLNALIDPTDPLRPYVTLTGGEFINVYGDIVADGTDSRTGMGDLYLLQGTVLTLNPRSLAFANQRIHTSSAAKSVTMTNTSAKVVAITSIALTGFASGQFASTNNCGSSLVGHAICTIKVTFKPTTKGAKSATLRVNGGGGGLRVVNLTGTGT